MYTLFEQQTRQESLLVLEKIRDPHHLLSIAKVNKWANVCVQTHCQKLIREAELIPGQNLGNITADDKRKPLWIYAALVCPILEAKEQFISVLEPNSESSITKYVGNYLTDGVIMTGPFKSMSPMEASMHYGCPLLMEKCLRVRFGEDSGEYKEWWDGFYFRGKEKTPENCFTAAACWYDSHTVVNGRYFPLTQALVRSQNLAVLKRFLVLFPESLQDGNHPHHVGPLFAFTAEQGSREMMDYLLSLRSNLLPETPDSKESLMHVAARENQVDMMEFLIGKKFEIDVPRKDGLTPLFIACQFAAVEAVVFLLSRETSVQRKVESQSYFRESKIETVFHAACQAYSNQNVKSEQVRRLFEVLLSNIQVLKLIDTPHNISNPELFTTMPLTMVLNSNGEQRDDILSEIATGFVLAGADVSWYSIPSNSKLAIRLCKALSNSITLQDRIDSKELNTDQVKVLRSLCELFHTVTKNDDSMNKLEIQLKSYTSNALML